MKRNNHRQRRASNPRPCPKARLLVELLEERIVPDGSGMLDFGWLAARPEAYEAGHLLVRF